jgi:anti-sigma factor RsiW
MFEHDGVEEYFAGVLQGSEKEDFERHLEGCTTCRKHLRELRKLDAELRRQLPRTISGKKPSPGWVKKLIAKVVNEQRS